MIEFRDQFGNQLRLARTLKGLSQQELGNQVSASRQYIHQLESASKQPSEELLDALCEALSVKPSFFAKRRDVEVTTDSCHFRKRKTTKQSLANQVAAFGTVFESFVSVLQEYVEFPSSSALDILETSALGHPEGEISKQFIEECADAFRKTLDLGVDTPIANVTNIIESLGIFLTTFNGISDKVDALSFSTKFHVILRNTAKESACRQRFDLAHELGHLILHQGIRTGEGSTEAEADYFASSFLFPRKAFMREFPFCLTEVGSFRWDQVLELKLRWKVSQRAIIYRAHALGLINARQYRNANIHFSTNKETKTERLDDVIPLEKPQMIEAALKALKDNAGLDFDSLASRTGFEGYYLASIFGLTYSSNTNKNILAFSPREI